MGSCVGVSGKSVWWLSTLCLASLASGCSERTVVEPNGSGGAGGAGGSSAVSGGSGGSGGDGGASSGGGTAQASSNSSSGGTSSSGSGTGGSGETSGGATGASTTGEAGQGGETGGTGGTDANTGGSGGTGGGEPDPCEGRLGEQDCPAEDCVDLMLAGHDQDGEYWIDPTGNGPAFEVHCDQTTDGGGWILVWKNHGGAEGGALSTADVFAQTGARLILPPERELSSQKHDQAFTHYFGLAGREWLKRGVLWDPEGNVIRRIALRVDMGEVSMQDVFAVDTTQACHQMTSPMEVFVGGHSLGSSDWVYTFPDADGNHFAIAHDGIDQEEFSKCGEEPETSENLVRTGDLLPGNVTLTELRLTGDGSVTINNLFSLRHLESGQNASRCTFVCWNQDYADYKEAYVWAVR